jgi:hypothetical protein
MPENRKIERTLKAFEFLKARAQDQKVFTVQALSKASGWSEVSVRTYVAKALGQVVERLPKDQLRAKREILRLSRGRFLGHMTQRKPIFSEYSRQKHENLLSFEFLLPLTREDKLRRALDDLFFTDTIRRRLREIGPQALSQVIPRDLALSDDEYFDSILKDWAWRVSGGYSISHASGRFRATDLCSRKEAGEMLADDRPYLVDESTAMVRLFVALDAGKGAFGGTFEQAVAALDNVEAANPESLAREVRIARILFFQLFVEGVVRTVEGEDEIWLLEQGPAGRRLYRWMRQY